MPFTRVKFDKHKHKKEKWITTGIIKSIRYRDKLRVKKNLKIFTWPPGKISQIFTCPVVN